MRLYRSDKIRFIVGLIVILVIYSCYYLFIAENKNMVLLPRKLRHVITLLITLAVYFVGTFHLGKLKATWMSTIWHIVHISGLCIIAAIGLYDWFILRGTPILALSLFARTIQEILISPILYVGMGLLNKTLNK